MKRVLIGARDFDHSGGVVGVVRALQPHFGRVKAGHFKLGRPPIGSWTDGLSVLRDNARLHRAKDRWDLLHINTSLRPRAVFRDGILLANWGRRPAVVTFHGWSDTLWRRFLAVPAMRRWFVEAYGDRPVIALAERFRDGLEALGLDRDDIEVIGPAYDGSDLGGAAAIEVSRIIFLGRLEPEKGVFELLEGFLEVADRAELVIVGDGSAAAKMAHWVRHHGLQRRVRLTGRLEGEHKVRMLQSASIFALPSHTEGLPVAMLEAMAAGLAVVVTDVGGVAEVVSHGQNGWLLADPSEVGTALAEAVSDPVRCRGMGALNRQIAERYEAKRIAARVEAAYLRELDAWS